MRKLTIAALGTLAALAFAAPASAHGNNWNNRYDRHYGWSDQRYDYGRDQRYYDDGRGYAYDRGLSRREFRRLQERLRRHREEAYYGGGHRDHHRDNWRNHDRHDGHHGY
jgi:opacity protein-like surface antigen